MVGDVLSLKSQAAHDAAQAKERVALGSIVASALITLAKGPGDDDVLTRARSLADHGRSAIRVASDLLRGDRDADPKTDT